MDVQDIISNALTYYDSAHYTIKYLLKKTRLDIKKTQNDQVRSVYKFYDLVTNKLILETEVEIMAIYYDKRNIWSWAWGHIGLYNSENYLSKEMLLYSLNRGSELAYIKSIINTSRGVIDPMQVDINLAIGCSLIKNKYVYPYIYNYDNYNLIYYIILLDQEKLEKLEKSEKLEKLEKLEKSEKIEKV